FEKFEKKITNANAEIKSKTDHLVSMSYGITAIDNDYQKAIIMADRLMYKQKHNKQNIH
ncbi:diguanylate cyclase, partial [Photobacterium sp. CAIM 1937]|nr:diguanylate cyclase [Photobacterium lucens]